jgi:hypothetical protein
MKTLHIRAISSSGTILPRADTAEQSRYSYPNIFQAVPKGAESRSRIHCPPFFSSVFQSQPFFVGKFLVLENDATTWIPECTHDKPLVN